MHIIIILFLHLLSLSFSISSLCIYVAITFNYFFNTEINITTCTDLPESDCMYIKHYQQVRSPYIQENCIGSGCLIGTILCLHQIYIPDVNKLFTQKKVDYRKTYQVCPKQGHFQQKQHLSTFLSSVKPQTQIV